jgi:hypothetical protein
VRVVSGDGSHWVAAFRSCRAMPGPAGLGQSPGMARSELHTGCNIPPGLIGLIAYLYHQVATSFPEAQLQRTPGLSVLGLEQFQDG